MGIFVKDGNGNVLRFIQACLSGLQTLNNTFFAYIDATREELKYNAQTINLQKRLNDLYDNDQRRIYINNINSGGSIRYISRIIDGIAPVYISRIDEGISPVYVSRIADLGADYSYIVQVPNGLVFNETKMIATIDRYNLVDKTYIIQNY
jgi:hypothetical protein